MQRDRYVVMANHLRVIIIREGGSRTAPTNNVQSNWQKPIFLTVVEVLYLMGKTEDRIRKTDDRIQNNEYRIME